MVRRDRPLPFDRLEGAALDAIPAGPGVYRFVDAQAAVVYVGKATNLRRRLSQYRRARRLKRHWKMRAIVRSATGVVVEACDTRVAAELREAELILELRPRWNVAGAFAFLYPSIGIGVGSSAAAPPADEVARSSSQRRSTLILAYSTIPRERPELTWHGAFRSRDVTRQAFYALVRLLSLVGHGAPTRRPTSGLRTRSFEIRQLPDGSEQDWTAFLRGDSRHALERLAMTLLEKPRARRLAGRVEEDLRTIGRFFRLEARRLRQACVVVGDARWPIPQDERDGLFIRARAARIGRDGLTRR